MTNTQKNKLQSWACYYDDRAEADYLPPEREATEEELEIEKILASDKEQQRWEAEARRAGLI